MFLIVLAIAIALWNFGAFITDRLFGTEWFMPQWTDSWFWIVRCVVSILLFWFIIRRLRARRLRAERWERDHKANPQKMWDWYDPNA